MAFRALSLAAVTVTIPVAYSQGVYQPKGWVFYDKQDGADAAWHLGARDKQLHFVCGAIAGSWAALLAEHWGATPKQAFWWGVLTSVCVGYLKEFYDLKKGSGTAEHADAMWVGIGGGIGASIVFVKIRW
jgi:hypothetical protein